MLQTLRFPPAMVVCLALAVPAVAQPRASDDVLGAVPPTALGVTVINNLQQASDHIDLLAAKLQLTAPHLLARARKEHPHLAAIDASRPMALIWVGAEPGASPNPVALLPVSDYKAFLQQLGVDNPTQTLTPLTVSGQEMLAGPRGRWAVLGKAKDRAAVEAVLAASGGPPEALAAWASWIAQQDAAGVLLPRGVDVLADAAQKGLATVQEAIKTKGSTADAPAAEQQQMAVRVLDMYRNWIDMLRKDVGRLAIGVRAGDQAAVMSSKVRWKQPSGSGETTFPPDQMLATLPNRPFAIAFSATLPKVWSQALMKFYGQSIKLGMAGMSQLSDQQLAKIEQAMTQAMQDVTGMSFLMGVPKAKGSIYADSYAVMKVKNAQQYLQNYKQSLAAMQEALAGLNLPFLPKYEVSDTQIAGKHALKLVMDFSQTRALPGNDQSAQVQALSQAMMRSLFGPEGKMEAYVAMADPTTVVIAYENADNLQTAIRVSQKAEQGLPARRQVTTTLELLPEPRQATVLISLSGLRQMIARFTQAMGVPENAVPQIPECPPIGLALSGRPEEFDKQLVVPYATLEAVGQAIGQFKQGSAQEKPVSVERPQRVPDKALP